MALFKKKNTILLLLTLLIGVETYSQSYKYEVVKNTYGKFIEKPDLNFENVENYLPEGYVTDGSKDYTQYIQKAIDKNEQVELPGFPILINDSGIKLGNNSTLYFNKGAKLILKPSKKEKYAMLQVKKVENVSIYNPTLVGERDEHIGDKGQWGHGINIEDAKNIKIRNVDISNTWGDGIYLRPTKNNEGGNVSIKYGSIDNVRRNGISIISAEDTTIDSVQISNTNGHNPASGIDIEPNAKHIHSIKNVVLKNIYTFNQERDGILVSITNLINSDVGNQVTIDILNHIDEKSRLGLRFPKAKKNKFTADDEPLTGYINIENGRWDSRNKKVIKVRKSNTHMPKTTIVNPQTNTISKEQLKERVQSTTKSLNRFEHIEKEK